jgi:hypothetical protein
MKLTSLFIISRLALELIQCHYGRLTKEGLDWRLMRKDTASPLPYLQVVHLVNVESGAMIMLVRTPKVFERL